MNTNPFDTLPKLKPGLAWWLPAGMSPEEATQKLGGRYRPLIAGQCWAARSFTDPQVWCERCARVHSTSDEVGPAYSRGEEPSRLYCTEVPVAEDHLPIKQTFAPLPAGASYINPQNATPEQVGVGEGWRLLCTLDKTYPEDTQFFLSGPLWSWEDDGVADMPVTTDTDYSRRTKAPVPAVSDKRQPGAWAEIRVQPSGPNSQIVKPLVRLVALQSESGHGPTQRWETSDGVWAVVEANILRNPENISTLPEGYRFITEAEFAQPAENWPEVALHSKSFGWMTDSLVRTDSAATLKQRPHWSMIVKRDAKFWAPPAPKGHNPAGIASPGAGYRFLTAEEVSVGKPIAGLEYWDSDIPAPEWVPSRNSSLGLPLSKKLTYRIKGSDPKPEFSGWHNPENVDPRHIPAGYRFATVEESKGLLPIDNGLWDDSGRFVVGDDFEREAFEDGWTYVVPVSWNLK